MNEAALIQKIRKYLATVPECFFGRSTVGNMVPLVFPISSSVTRDASLHWKPRSAEIPRQSYKRLPLTRSEKLVEQQ